MLLWSGFPQNDLWGKVLSARSSFFRIKFDFNTWFAWTYTDSCPPLPFQVGSLRFGDAQIACSSVSQRPSGIPSKVGLSENLADVLLINFEWNLLSQESSDNRDKTGLFPPDCRKDLSSKLIIDQGFSVHAVWSLGKQLIMYNQNANNELFLYVLIRSLSYLFF